MAIESWTHAHGMKIEETITCTTKEEFESIKRVLPQTFAGFEYMMTTKQRLNGWRIRIMATRAPVVDTVKPVEEVKVEVQDDAT
jgi:hypothetical protein